MHASQNFKHAFILCDSNKNRHLKPMFNFYFDRKKINAVRNYNSPNYSSATLGLKKFT